MREPSNPLIPRALMAVLAAVLLTTAAPAQQHPNLARGFESERLYSILGIDQIAPFSGTLSLTLPLGTTYPAGGDLTYGFTLVYSANAWNWSLECAGPGFCYSLPRANPDSNAGLSWMLNLGRLIPPNTPPRNPGPFWLYLSPDGAQRPLYPVLHVGEPSSANVFYSRDGSYLRLRKLGTTWELDVGDTVHTFTAMGQLTQIRDRFGNFLAIDISNPDEWVLSDNHGREHRIFFSTKSYDGASVRMIDKVRLATFGGTTADYDFTYTQGSIMRPCPFLLDNNPFLPNTASVPLLTKLTLPDGSSYDIAQTDYVLSRESGCQNPGVLRKIRLPTLGYIAWDYGLYTFPTGSVRPIDYPPGAFPAYFTQKPGVTQRRLLDENGNQVARWLYAPDLVVPQPVGQREPVEMTNTITDPNDHQRVLYFSVFRTGTTSAADANPRHYGLPITPRTNDGTSVKRFLSEEVFDSKGTKLRSIYRRYENDAPTNPLDLSELAFNPRMFTERTVYHDDGDRYREVTYSNFDGLGHYRQATTGGNFGRANVRSTFTNYNPSQGTYPGAFTLPASTAPWVLGTYSETSESEAGSTARSETCFEASTGFLLRERRLASSDGTRQKKDVLSVYVRDSAGNPTREQYYGSDVQDLALGADLCNLSLPASDQYRLDHEYQFGVRRRSRYAEANGTPSTFYVLDLDIDKNTGLPTASRDTAGLQTDFSYDTLGRLTWEMPASGHDAWINYVYNRATGAGSLANVKALGRENGSMEGMVITRQEFYFDALGRLWQEKKIQPTAGWVTRETQRDGLGQPTQVSEWEITPTNWTKYLDRDPFGRPATIRPPDGASHDVSFTFEGDRIVKRTVKIGTARAGNGTITETDATTTEEYDGQLRLWKVTEPAGGQTADYRYDAAQRLSEVRLTVGANQSRFFTYDNRGFMTSEQHPETGVITYSAIDARGHAGRRQWGPNDLAFTYDRLERLTQVKEATGQERLLKEFSFATNNAGTNLRRGKLTSAVRHNWIPVPWAGGAVIDVTVSESYTYAGKGGRVSKRTTAVSTGPSFSQEWAYTQFGDVESLTYPRCTQISCTSDPTSGSPRTVSFGYTRAQLTSVAGYAGSINYHPSGMVNTVAHSNGVNEITDADPAGMRRPKEIRTTGTFSASLGAHLYDGAGNVVARGAEHYLYDAVSRLVRYNTTSTSYQSYAYDSYGNMTSLSFFNGTSTTTRSFSVSAQTNQLTGAAAYDSAGNVTSWGGHTYGYDAFNMQVSHDYPDWLHLYTADNERIVSLRYTGTSPIEETYTLRDLSGKALTSYKAVGGNSGVWSWEKDYIYRDGLLLAAETSEPWPKNVQHHVVDHLGTPRLVTGANGSVVAIHHYFGFGEEIGGGADPERLRFTGHERDFHEAGTQDDLDYMHARYCSPQLARFMSVDPINSASMRMPQSWNRYSYTLNSPLTYVDPSGEKWFRTDEGWEFFDGVDYIESLVVNEAGTTTSTQVAGLDYLVTFDGEQLVFYNKDGATLDLEATSGFLDESGNTQPELQNVRDVGPIPEGEYSFDPAQVQTMGLVDGFIGLRRYGAWPGSFYAWGAQRVFLTPAEGTQTFGRSGFAIHGGARPGSRGCIDLCNRASDFFDVVEGLEGPVPVFVRYPFR